MNKDDKHNGIEDFSEETKEIFSKLKVDYTTSKEAVWDKIMDADSESKTIKLFPTWAKAMAAAILLLISTGLVFRFYSKTIYCSAGNQMAVVLPDSSTVLLNADSKLSYHPLWWKISRELAFKGEAYFKVKKGSRFAVESPSGTTTVLGTSFTVYDRSNSFKVACLTGKVAVTNTVDSTVLTPNNKLKLSKDGNFIVTPISDKKESTAWMHKQFYFKAEALNNVFSEIALRYGVSIKTSQNLQTDSLVYTGSFQELKSVENVITLVCKPFNLEFYKLSGNEYVIVQKR